MGCIVKIEVPVLYNLDLSEPGKFIDGSKN
jgi:hypothetical protein